MAASWQNTEAKATFERSDEVPDQRTALMCMLEDVIESSPIPDFAEIAKLALQILETAKVCLYLSFMSAKLMMTMRWVGHADRKRKLQRVSLATGGHNETACVYLS
jgi:hypothetical protein